MFTAIIVICLVFFIFGTIGKVLGFILEILFDGCLNSLGCLFWVFVILMIAIII